MHEVSKRSKPPRWLNSKIHLNFTSHTGASEFNNYAEVKCCFASASNWSAVIELDDSMLTTASPANHFIIDKATDDKVQCFRDPLHVIMMLTAIAVSILLVGFPTFAYRNIKVAQKRGGCIERVYTRNLVVE